MDQRQDIRRSPQDFLRIAWRRRVIVVVSTVVAVTLMLGIDTLRSPIYGATTKVVFLGKNLSTSAMATNVIRLMSGAT
jgi:uncharacterized protein involved in exopolysaccharide biosynthesis